MEWAVCILVSSEYFLMYIFSFNYVTVNLLVIMFRTALILSAIPVSPLYLGGLNETICYARILGYAGLILPVSLEWTMFVIQVISLIFMFSSTCISVEDVCIQ